MRLTQLVESLPEGRWRCGVCQWRCTLEVDQVGRCLVRRGLAEGISIEHDSLVSAAEVSAVEDHRLWHLLPGTPVLALGGWGYALPSDQQRGAFTQPPEDQAKHRRLEPERAAKFALDRLCRGVVWNYSDPSVSAEYVHDLLAVSRASSRYTALVTSGYATPEALDLYGHYLDAVGLELRAFDDAAYARLGGVEHWRGILEFAERAVRRWGCHIEVTTRLHPGVNDAPEQIQAMAGWIRDTLGPHTAWHILPGDAGSAAAATVGRARRLGHEAGLHFIYVGDQSQSTQCFSCGVTVIARGPAGVRVSGLDNGRCSNCGTDLRIRTSIFKRG